MWKSNDVKAIIEIRENIHVVSFVNRRSMEKALEKGH